MLFFTLTEMFENTFSSEINKNKVFCWISFHKITNEINEYESFRIKKQVINFGIQLYEKTISINYV